MKRRMSDLLPEPPTHFTDREGGKWLPFYIKPTWTYADLEHAEIGLPHNRSAEFKDKIKLKGNVLIQVSEYRQDIKNYPIHSLAWNPLYDNEFPRWDEYNGWTTPLPEKE